MHAARAAAYFYYIYKYIHLIEEDIVSKKQHKQNKVLILFYPFVSTYMQARAIQA